MAIPYLLTNRCFLLFICVILLTSFVLGQSPHYKFYYSRTHSGECTSGVWLYDNGVYHCESGCYTSSYISFGKYSTKKGILTLTPINITTFNPLEKVAATQTNSDSISVTILDKNGRYITNRIATFISTTDSELHIVNFNKADSIVERVAYKGKGGKVVLKTISRIFGKRFEFSTDSANSFIIQINIPGEWFQRNSKWNASSEFEFLKKGDNLISFPMEELFELQKE